MITLRSAALIFAFATLLSSCDNKQEAGKTADGKTAEAQTIEALPPAEAKITSIAYNFKEGDVRRYKMEQTDEFTQDDSIKATNILSLYYTKTIKRVKDGMITFSIRYDSIQQQQRGSSVNGAPPTDLKYNSNDSASKSKKEFLIMNALVGETVDVTMDNKGKVEEFGGLSTIVNSIAKKSGQDVGEREKSMLAEQLKIAFYGQVVVQEHQALPDSTLDSTMAWSRSAVQQIPPYLIANNKMNYKVNTVGKMDGTKVLNISAALKGEIAVVDKKLPIKIKASSVTGKGTSVIEAETGYTRSKETSMVQSIQMDVTPPQTNKTQTLKQVKTMKLSVKMMN